MLSPFRSQFKDDIKTAGELVRLGLQSIDKWHPGNCLWAAVVGIDVLHKMGYTTASLQAGSCQWRRISNKLAKERGEEELTAFGFHWSPDDPISIDLMQKGMMPEYHAWIGIPEPGSVVNNVSARGLMVDFSAHSLPEITITNKLAWVEPRPDYPAVVLPEDMEDESDEGGMGKCFYSANAEATLFCHVSAQALLVKMYYSGDKELAEMLWEQFDPHGTCSPGDSKSMLIAATMTCQDILKTVRRMLRESPKHFMTETPLSNRETPATPPGVGRGETGENRPETASGTPWPAPSRRLAVPAW